MTVDMLAATFFWPEGTLLGSHHPHPGDPALPADVPAGHQAAAGGEDGEESFWTTMRRYLWRVPAAGRHDGRALT